MKKNLSILVVAFMIFSFFGNNVFAQAKFSTGKIISFKSVNYPNKFIRHRNFLGELTTISSALDKKDASFKVVPALNGKKGYVSFESVNYPGYYLRHQNFVIKLHKKEGSKLYKEDASFKPRKGLAQKGYTFESSNYPGRYIRHRNFKMYLEPTNNSPLFNKDASFFIDKSFISNTKSTLKEGQ